MRAAFFRAVLALAERDERVMLVVGDLGFGVVEPFASRFPARFLNVGVAEKNMTGIAAGLALSCLEQIRNDVCYHNANVKVVAVGGGLAYGALGSTHHATEDLAIMRTLPRMVVVAPGDPVETELLTRAVAAEAGPCYMRLGRAGERAVHPAHLRLQLGKAIVAREGSDLTLISTGGLLGTAVRVAEHLARDQHVESRVLSMHTVKPVDADAIVAAARDTRALVTLEEHSLTGGLGSAVAEILGEHRPRHASQLVGSRGDHHADGRSLL